MRSSHAEPPGAIDRRRRSPITMPEHRLGKPAPNKGRTFPVEVLTEAEVLALLKACSSRGSAGLRDQCMIVFQWRTGIRVGELVALRPADVDLDAGTLTILHGKGDRRRVVGIDPQACAVGERWAKRRAQLGIPRRWQGEPTPFFCVISHPVRGKPIWPSVYREKLKDLAERAGIEKRVHPHGFRHTCAVDLHHREGMPAQFVQKQLGHSSLATTERYLDHLAPAQVVAAMRSRAWAGLE